MTKRIAVIDMGTNTFQLIVAEGDASGYEVTHRERIFVKIGAGGISAGRLTAEAFDRALGAMQHYADVLRNMGVQMAKGIATSAIRNAENGADLLALIRQQTGIPCEVISGTLEAELIFDGVRTVYPLTEKPVLVVDIGGGSVEFILGKKDGILWKQSFEIGAQRLYDRFHQFDPMPPYHQEMLMEYLDSELQPLRDWLPRYEPTTLVGCAGTFSTMRDIFCAANGLSNSEAHLFMLSSEDYWATHERFAHAPVAERLAIPGMLPERADMIVVASSIVMYLIQSFGFEQVAACRASLKEGVMFRLFRM